MTERVRIQVDGAVYEVESGLSLLQALDECGAQGAAVEIPHYCWHPKLSVDASCGLCQVELSAAGASPDEVPRLAVACATPVEEGLVVDTRSARVAAVREGLMELLLANHPLDCPVCDQAGECALQDHAERWGRDAARTREPRRKLRKRVDLGPTLVLDEERCILCRRCVRFCREVTGTGELGVFDRGDRSVVGTFPGQLVDNDYSMNVADLCPVGALTTKDFRFKMRVWLLESVPSLCTGCGRGCNVWADVAKNEVQRYRPRRNDAVNGTWMCDAGRLSYHDVARSDRLRHCLVRRPGPDGSTELLPASADDAVRETARRLRALLAEKGPGVVAGLASAQASNEDLRAFKTFLDVLDVDGVGLVVVEGEADELLVVAEKGANAAGARAVGFGDPAPVLERLRGGGVEALLLLGHDLTRDGWLGGTGALEALDTVVVFDTHRSALERVADVVFPVRHAAEKSDAYTNAAGVVQRVERAVAPAAGVLDERDWIARIAAALELPGFAALGRSEDAS